MEHDQPRPRAARWRQRLTRAARLGAAAAVLLSSGQAFAARCTAPADQTAFEIMALKTELMVVALRCNGHDEYGAFVNRFRPALLEANTNFLRYYSRAFGRNGQHMADSYITALANGRQQESQSLGSDFCARNRIVYAEVMALPANTDLPAFAAGKDPVPMSLGSCEGQTPRGPAPARAGRARAR